GIRPFGALACLASLGGTVGSPTAIELRVPTDVAAAGGQTMADYNAGKQVAAQSGCLACHKFGESGNDGPGPPLEHIARRLPRQAIARTLINPTAPMPSFKNLPPEKFRVLVAFLGSLR